MDQTCTTFYLEMTMPSELREKPQRPDLRIVEREVPQPELNRFLYGLVGQAWAWVELDHWSDAQWRELVEQEGHRTWVAYHRGAIAGYYELYHPDGRNAEIRYFGLAAAFLGCDFGGALLSHALRSA